MVELERHVVDLLPYPRERQPLQSALAEARIVGWNELYSTCMRRLVLVRIVA